MSDAAQRDATPISGRKAARRLAIQALYQWDLTGDGIADIVEQCMAREPGRMAVDYEYFDAMVRGVATSISSLDARYEPFLDRPTEQLDPIERAVLRAGAWEFENRLDIPYRVVINEAVDLAKVFGAEDGHKYINGVLDKLARHVRVAETQRRPS
ncbi:MAG: transcription antitermination factor NusB [Pseudomonadota bacterium]